MRPTRAFARPRVTRRARSTAKSALFDLLHAAEDNSRMELTGGYAMLPCSVGQRVLYFAHPESRTLYVGDIQEDQVEDYAARKGISREDVLRLLPANLPVVTVELSRLYQTRSSGTGTSSSSGLHRPPGRERDPATGRRICSATAGLTTK